MVPSGSWTGGGLFRSELNLGEAEWRMAPNRGYVLFASMSFPLEKRAAGYVCVCVCV